MKTTKLSLLFAAALCAVWLVGCSTPASRISANPAAFAQLAPQQQAMVQAGQVGVGFSMDAVKLALGDPDRVTLRHDASGQTQVWHYVDYDYSDAYDMFPYYPGFYPGFYGHYGRRGGWGGGWGAQAGWWGPPYPFYLTYGETGVHDHVRIEFKDSKVVSVSEEMPN